MQLASLQPATWRRAQSRRRLLNSSEPACEPFSSDGLPACTVRPLGRAVFLALVCACAHECQAPSCCCLGAVQLDN